MTLLFVSPEIRDEIFSFCSYKDLQNLAGTCRAVRQEINDHARRRSKNEYNKTVQISSKSRIPRDWIACYVKFVRTICVDCGTSSVGRKNKTAPVWCDTCRKKRYPVMTKIDAKTGFLLNEIDLQALQCTKVENNMFPTAPQICLYERSQVEEAALKKFGGKSGLSAALLVVQERKDQLHDAQIMAQHNRRQKLMTLLSAASVPFSPNSEICKRFITSGRIRMKNIVTEAKREHIMSVHTSLRYSNYRGSTAEAASLYYEELLNGSFAQACTTCGDPIHGMLPTRPKKPRFGPSFVLPVKAVHAHAGMTERAKNVAQGRDRIAAEIYDRQFKVDKFLHKNVVTDEKLQELRKHAQVTSFIENGDIDWSIFFNFLNHLIA